MSKAFREGLLKIMVISALAVSVAPTYARAHGISCGGNNMERVRMQVEALPDGDPSKWVAIKELAMASTSYSMSRPDECAIHLGRAISAGMVH